MKTSNIITGLIFILVGTLMLLNNLGLMAISWDLIWPLFLLVPGLIFELSYFTTRKDPGLLVPGGILTTYGLFFYFNIFTGWQFMDVTWPIFTFGVAVGLFQLFYFGKENIALFYVSMGIGGFSLLAILSQVININMSWFFPAALILVGLFFIFSATNQNKTE